MSEELLTVEAAAEALSLHAKTVLRHIREGRLRATKVGKQYRILRSDLASFAGAPVQKDDQRGRATAIVDVDDVDEHLLRRLSTIVLAAGQRGESESRLSVNVAHDPIRRSAKVITIGSAGDVAMVLKLVETCLEA